MSLFGLATLLLATRVRPVVEIGPQHIELRRLGRRTKTWALDDIVASRSTTGNSIWTTGMELQTRDGKQHALTKSLSQDHAEWLAETINAQLEDRR